MHFLFNNKKETKGILSDHLIVFLQLGQKDRVNITLLSAGIRWIQTLEKLPQIHPNTKKIIKNTNQILNWEAILTIPSIQY